VKLFGLQFTVIGTFKERTGTFGQSEIADETVLIPITEIKLFTPVERVDPMYVQARYSSDVRPLTAAIKQVLESRHRQGAKFEVFNLSGILEAAEKIAHVLTLVLVTVSTIALVISGIGIMNIMAGDGDRTDAGDRAAHGGGCVAQSGAGAILTEAVVLSVGGGFIGILIGISIPLSVRFLTDQIRVPISPVSIGGGVLRVVGGGGLCLGCCQRIGRRG